MGEGVVEDGALHEVCAECRLVCQTSHGEGSPHAVPRFFKTIVEHSTPSSTNCHLQIPASFIRNHIGLSNKETYVVVGAQGCEWALTFNAVGFKNGWKEFSIAYQLEKGDGIMLSLVAPKRFYANVFDKFGMEKCSTKQTRNRRASPPSKENQVSNSMNGDVGTAEDRYNTPLGSHGTHLPREGKSNGTHPHMVPGTSARASGENGNHDNRMMFKDEHHLSPNEPVGPQTQLSTMSQSSDDSEDSIQVRLAKAVLAKSRRRKLKKRMKTSSTSTPQAVEGTIIHGEGTTVEVQACLNDDRADGTIKADPTESALRKDDIPASVDDAMFENPCEEPRALTDIHAPLVVGEGIGVSNVEKVTDLQAESQPVKLLQVEETPPPLPLQRPEAATGEVGSSKRVKSSHLAGDRSSPLFIKGLVKLECDPSPHQTSGNCNNCGKKKEAPKLDGSTPPKSEPVTTDSPSLDVRIPEARSPIANAPRVTESQKQRAQALAVKLSGETKNPNALVVGRVSMLKPHGCFLSNMCSEMLPSVDTELTLMDTEGNAHRVQWNPNQRIMDGPGWNDFVVSHNLHADDFWVMEVVDPTEHNVVVKAHIFHSHEMERSPERQPPGARAAPGPTGPAKTPATHAKTPPSPAQTPALLPVLGTPAPVLGTGAKTRSSSQLLASAAPPSKSNKRGPASPRPSEIPGSTETPRPSESRRPGATTAAEDDRLFGELTRPSLTKRPRRGSSSSPSSPRRGIDSTPTSGTRENPSPATTAAPPKPARKLRQQATRRPGLSTPHGPRRATAGAVATPGGGASSPSASAVQPLRSRPDDEGAEPPKQVRTRNSQKTQYQVSKVIDRRKSLHGVVFLVELTDRVRPENLQKRVKAQQDEKGRWWVPHHHFNHNFSACYLE